MQAALVIRLMPAVLQRLMRHTDIATTMKYYVTIEADDVAAQLWGLDDAADNASGNSRPTAAKKAGADMLAGTEANPIGAATCDGESGEVGAK